MARQNEHADVVVVGSGFGGSVTAYRFAQAGKHVVLLERGKAYPPGSFARSPVDMAKNFWDPSEGLHGLFDLWSFRDFESIVSSGLGGGSLIYANVLLRKDEKWFVRDASAGDGYESWPISRADLEPHYDAVEKMMQPQLFPKGQPGYEASRRTELLEQAGRSLGYPAFQPPLAVTFSVGDGPPAPGAQIPTPAYGNYHGLPRITCVLTGECDLGCNYGSKNTLDHNYLSAAKHSGADIRVHHEVRTIAPLDGGGYAVGYVVHQPGKAARTAELAETTITCDRLVLAAGTYGTTYLLLRNRAALPGISRRLGRRFSGNGDLLGFVKKVPGAPLGTTHGPVITTAVRVPDALDRAGKPDGPAATRGPLNRAKRGVYIEDASYPTVVEWLVEATQVTSTLERLTRTAISFVVSRIISRGPSRRVGSFVSKLLGSGKVTAGEMPLLGMGRDVPLGVMSVREDHLQIEHYPDGSWPYFEGAIDVMKGLAKQMGGKFAANPTRSLARAVTVHPLGGASMGVDAASGVIDEWGEVFGYPGLYVADGASMPGPVGANPSFTIAAFADRLADHALQRPTVRRRVQATGRVPAGT